MTRLGRNDPCPCGSGRKYKNCCRRGQTQTVGNLAWKKLRKTEGELMPKLCDHVITYYGGSAWAEAWDEFSLWEDVPMDPENEPEIDTIFMPWFVFDWTPDNAEIDDAAHLPEIPVAMHYLQKLGTGLSSTQRRFIEEACAEPYSFFEVVNVSPGKNLTLRDLFIDRQVQVLERQASQTLYKGAILFTKVISLNEVAIMLGCAPIVIPPIRAIDIMDYREVLAENFDQINRDFIRDYDVELRQMYYAFRNALLTPTIPELQNTDGEPVQLTKLHYALHCTPHEALASLATLSLVTDPAELFEHAQFDQHGELKAVEFPWLKRGNRQHKSWDNTVLGHIAIKGEKLTIDVNSEARAESIKRKITKRLGKRAKFVSAVIESAQKLAEALPSREAGVSMLAAQSTDPADEALLASPEMQQHLSEMAKRHWQDWLDTPLPALKNETPRNAAKHDAGRMRLHALLTQFEQQTMSPQPFRPDVAALRRALGMD